MTVIQKKTFALEEYIALLALCAIGLYLLLHFLFKSPFANYPLYIALAGGGIPLIFKLLRQLFTLQFSADLIAGLSIITAIILGQYLAGTLVVLMLSGGQSIERYSVRKASRVLEELAMRAPNRAKRKTDKGIEDIPSEEIKIGDTLVIFPYAICPVDGEVIEGKGNMDESYLTGEPFFISKTSGSQVLSGAINGENALTIQATKLAVDSRYAKIMKVMLESEQRRPRMRRLADQLGAWYTPLAILIALFAWIFSQDPIRFLAVLVIATPCPLLLAIPIAIIGAISLSASRGIIIKNPAVLEQLDQCKTLILDKTGTLTYGTPFLEEQILFGSENPTTVLRLAATLEKYSKHPLSSAILEKAKEEGLSLSDAENVSEPKGLGLKGTIEGRPIWITSRKSLENRVEEYRKLPEEKKGLECVIVIDDVLAACYHFRDTPRKESRSFVNHLTPKHGFKKIMIVSGDQREEVSYLADYVGIKEIHASMSPEEKVTIVEKERAKAKTVFLGDGINDAPALVAATVGIAFGQNSEITAEAADAIVLENSLEKVDEFFHISRRMRKIALQSALGGIALSLLGMAVAAAGYLPPVAGAISQEIIDIIAIVNSLRILWPVKRLSDMPFEIDK